MSLPQSRHISTDGGPDAATGSGRLKPRLSPRLKPRLSAPRASFAPVTALTFIVSLGVAVFGLNAGDAAAQTSPQQVTNTATAGATTAEALKLAQASAERRFRPGDETAVLPIDRPGADLADDLPAVLSAADADRYRKIFARQENGDWKTADRLIKRLDDRLLMGHVMFQRYMHPTAYRSSWRELKTWMGAYADHPDADRVYDLATKRKPANATPPPAPVKGYLGGNGADAVVDATFYVSPRKRSDAELRQVRAFKRDVRRLVRKGRTSAALKKLDSAHARAILDTVEFAQVRAGIAKGLYVFGKDEQAFKLAKRSADEAGKDAPMAHWIAGLAAWRMGNADEATGFFETVSLSERASRAERSAGAYWASRGHLQSRRPAQATRWLARAAQYPLTFYGLLGRRALGVEIPFDWSLPRVTDEKVERLKSYKGGRRALALMQIGESQRAEGEWRKLFPRLDPSLREPLVTLATRHDMPGLAVRLAGILRVTTGRTYHAALYPVPSWAPEDGFEIDRAVIFGLIRQESGFDTRAKSYAGARGLMQLMPKTANYIDTEDDLDGRHALYDPALNMSLGQRYVGYLLDMDRVEGDMFKLLVAYNAGPGNLNKWRRKVDYKNDPLLFIESIPSWETRDFIEKVLANIWVYRYRLGQSAPSLDKAAAGAWPGYRPVDSEDGYVLRHANF